MEQVTHPVSSSFPATPPNGKHPVVVNSVHWEQWLTMLRTLPAEAPEWDGLATFLKAVGQLSEAKRLERESGHRLRQALMSLAANCSDGLDFFGLTNEVLEWTGEAYPPTEVAALVEAVEMLRGLLGKHWALYQKRAAPTLSEERARRHALLELENDVTKAYDRLAQTFQTAHTAPPPEPAPPQKAEHKPPQKAQQEVQQKAQQEVQQKAQQEAQHKPSQQPQPEAQHKTPQQPQRAQHAAPLKKAKGPDKSAAPASQASSPSVQADTAAFKFIETTAPEPRKTPPPAPVEPLATPAVPVAPVTPEIDHSHSHLDSAARQYNPLTRTQERQLNSIRSGISLIFASEALGCSHIVEAYKRVTPPDVPKGVTARCQEIPSKMSNSDQIEQWLEHYVQEHEQGSRLVAYRPLSNGTKEHLIEQVQAALDVCKRPDKGQRPWLGVAFIFDPRATWSWLSLPPQYREAVEDEADVMTSPWRWNVSGIQQRLSHHHKMHTNEVCQQVLEATGGWPYLLDVLFYRCGTQNDPRPFAEAIQREITENSTKLVQQFHHCLGLDSNENTHKVLTFIHKHKQVPVSFGATEASEEELPLPPAAYSATVEYLRRLGCVEIQDSMLSVESIVAHVLP